MRHYALNIPVSTAAIIGLLVSSVVFITVKHHEERELRQKFNHIASNIAQDLEKEVNTQLYTLDSITTFFETAEFVDRYDFYTLTTPLYKRSAAFQAIEWVPIVSSAEQTRYESFALYDGFSNFQIFERNAQGERVPSADRDAYYPVFYLEPYQGNEAALGYDLGSESSRLATINAALKSKSISASSPITLIQGDHSRPATLIFAPIFEKVKPNSPEQRISGFIVGAIEINRLLSNISPAIHNNAAIFKNINITLFEKNNRESRVFISSKNYPKLTVPSYKENIRATMRNVQKIQIANKTWEVVTSVNHYKYLFLPNLNPLYAAGISMLFFITLIFYLILLLKQKSHAENTLKEKTASLISSEKSLQATVENMADGLITIDSKGSIQSFNSAAEGIFGYSQTQVIGENVSMLMPEPFKSKHDSYLTKYSETGKKNIIGIGREVKGLKSDGTLIFIELSVSEITIDDQAIFIGIIRDITEHKKLERMKNEFISTVSHELRTPLTSIRGALSIIINKSEDDFSEKTNRMLATAEKNSKRLGQLINDILDMEKLDAGMLSFKKDALHANAIAKAAMEAGETYAKIFHITLSTQCPLPNLMILGDEGRLLQVLANLLSNAIKFSPEGSQVRIEVSLSDAMVRFTVFDHGEGVSETFRPYIFERFSQADASDTRERGGTGLGLNISRAIVEKHKGNINFYRTPENETAFYFEVPVFSLN